MDICSTCGQEVRRGVRGSDPKWPGPRYLHRENVDHEPTFGALMTKEGWAAAMEMIAVSVAAKEGKKEEAEEDLQPVLEDIPDPEIRAEDVDVETFPPRSGIRQVINLILKTRGWELVSVTRARGPYVGARGQALSISDSILVRARGPVVDGVRRVGVASWRDGKFDSATIGEFRGGTLWMIPDANKSTDLKNWIKGIPRDLPDALHEPGERPG